MECLDEDFTGFADEADLEDFEDDFVLMVCLCSVCACPRVDIAFDACMCFALFLRQKVHR